jgi:hypothetical protein
MTPLALTDAGYGSERLDRRMRERVKRVWTGRLGIWIVLLLALAIRLETIHRYGLGLNLHSDDQGYTNSAIWLLQRGVYGFYTPHHSTLHMMPGITILLAGVFFVFGTGVHGIYAAKIVMSIIGVIGIFGIYLVGSKVFSKPVGLIAALLAAVYIPGVETDTLLLTESPFFVSSTFFFYFILRAGEEHRARFLYYGTIFYVLGIYFRPTIAAYPIVALVYLLMKRYPVGRLMKQAGVVALLIVALMSPWWIRNAMTFHHFVPLTDGTGNPLLLGTFQGHGYPAPATADQEIKFLKQLHPELRPTKDHEVAWFALQTQVAKQRMVEWLRSNPRSFFDSFLLIKPRFLWYRAYYPIEIYRLKTALMWNVQHTLVNLSLLGYLIALLFGRKRRLEVTLILVTFAYYTALYCLYFAYARYAEPSMPLMLMGIPAGLWGLWMLGRRLTSRNRQAAATE